MRKWRRGSDLGIRAAAAVIGISSATLSRIERGESMDGATLAKLLGWLMGGVK